MPFIVHYRQMLLPIFPAIHSYSSYAYTLQIHPCSLKMTLTPYRLVIYTPMPHCPIYIRIPSSYVASQLHCYVYALDICIKMDQSACMKSPSFGIGQFLWQAQKCTTVASYSQSTVWRKCLTGENFDKFDESNLRQNFPYQYFTFQQNNLSTSSCNINGSRESVYEY